MSEQNTNTETHQEGTPVAVPATPEQEVYIKNQQRQSREQERIESAMAEIPDYEDPIEKQLKGFNTESDEDAPQKTQEPQEKDEREQKPGESKSEYYARLSNLDRENRQLKQRLKSLEQQGNPAEQLRALAKQNPIKALEHLGLSFDDIIDHWAGQKQTQQEEESSNNNTSNKEIQEIKEEFARLKEEKRRQEYQQQLYAEYNKFYDLVQKDDGNRWEYIKNFGDEEMYATIFETAKAAYQQTGTIPDYSDVLDSVEEYFVDQEKEKFKSLSKVSKIRENLDIEVRKEPVVIDDNKPLVSPSQQKHSATLRGSSTDTPIPDKESSAKSRFEDAMRVMIEAEKRGDPLL